MSYQERRTIANLISTIVYAVIYFLYVAQNYPQQANPYSAEVFHFWGASVFVLIPVSIVIKIVVEILVSIGNTMATKEKATLLSDERDKLIDFRGLRNALYTFALGFVLAMGALVFDLSPSVMFLVIFVSGFVSGLVGDASKLYIYRRGF